MAKPKTPVKTTPSKKKVARTEKGMLPYYMMLGLVGILTIIAYLPSLQNTFVNWDDIVYIMNNDMIRSLSGENIHKIFTSYWMGNYHPFTLLSFAFDYHFVEVTPYGYHLHNFILHIVNALLVAIFVYRLFRKNLFVAFIAAALFAVHPLHVESVGWISERKDLLYTFWFLLSLIAYLLYLEKQKPVWLVASLVMFVFSLLAKAQAVTLPLAIVVIDIFRERKFTAKTIAEKLPFFILALGAGIVAVLAQRADAAVNVFHLTKVQSFFFGSYSLGIHLFKSVFPLNQRALYEYPFDPGHAIPFYIYLMPLLLPILAFTIWKTWKKNRYISFGLLFFLVTVLPVLQFFPVGEAVFAERYTYIPYIGLFMIAGAGFEELRGRIEGGKKNLMIYGGIGVLVLFVLLTWARIQVWKDSVSLWTDVIEKNPSSVTAYINRGFIYNQDDFKDYNKALEDCNTGMKYDSNNHKLYINRATAYRHLQMYDQAIADYTRSLQKDSTDYQPYLDRGVILTDNLGRFDEGIADFKNYIQRNPDNKNVWYNLGVAYYKKGIADSSIRYIVKTIDLAPDYSQAYYVGALAYALKGDFKNALDMSGKARSMGVSIDEATLSQWQQAAMASQQAGH
jgi:protein O-mannosyl-transferase